MIKQIQKNIQFFSQTQCKIVKSRVNTDIIRKTKEIAKNGYLYTKKVVVRWLVVFFTPVIFLNNGLFFLLYRLYLARFDTRRLYAGFQGVDDKCHRYRYIAIVTNIQNANNLQNEKWLLYAGL
ncbi:hypothetical protein DESAMIL20_675 [Desulfurella amilsii]|jgi:hypothetical protein|uniref:Uncharacterized protein n=1 Tax=Desulfurella amilsii TaxID=1562698 RepID=A0A1X4XY73_9BACT|nr:hypothetical protein [Desulfurella amilsii]OSS42491.1 hypothetical protein DESAMIL20_675 [Desulfurella amilsii]